MKNGGISGPSGNPRQNHILATLPDAVYQRLLPDLTHVQMPLGWALYESGDHMSHLYFPTTSIVSLLYVMENGASGEIAITGSEGLVGVSLFMGSGGERTTNRAIVQGAGCGYRLKANVLKREFMLGGQFQHAVLCFTQALMTQMSQTAVCNRHHTLNQQLCRWLLMTLDRLPDNEIHMTQELIAGMLGVRREGVTEAVGRLKKDGLITCTRGHITVLDRPELEKRVCECYAVVNEEYDRLLKAHGCIRDGSESS